MRVFALSLLNVDSKPELHGCLLTTSHALVSLETNHSSKTITNGGLGHLWVFLTNFKKSYFSPGFCPSLAEPKQELLPRGARDRKLLVALNKKNFIPTLSTTFCLSGVACENFGCFWDVGELTGGVGPKEGILKAACGISGLAHKAHLIRDSLCGVVC